jgi:putrescine transport system substrate-binding protein
MLAIPKDAPHPDNAHAFINFVLDPKVISEVTNFKGYANANAGAQPLASVKSNPGIYPTAELLPKLTVQLADSADQSRAITRVWEKFKTAQ